MCSKRSPPTCEIKKKTIKFYIDFRIEIDVTFENILECQFWLNMTLTRVWPNPMKKHLFHIVYPETKAGFEIGALRSVSDWLIFKIQRFDLLIASPS